MARTGEQGTGRTCARCGMPLAYDAHVAAIAGAAGAASDRLCSHCDGRRAFGRRRARPAGRAWMLDALLHIHRSGSGTPQALAGLLSRFPSLLPGYLRRISRLVGSFPVGSGGSAYDAAVLYSGGKDSTYMLVDLAGRRGLRLCAWMLAHDYQSPTALENAAAVCERLGVPLVLDRPDGPEMAALLRLGLGIGRGEPAAALDGAMTYGSACWPCFAVLLARASRFCAAKGIPLCFLGTQKGQNELALMSRPELADGRLPLLSERARELGGALRELASARGVAGGLMEVGAGRTALVPFYEFVPAPARAELLAAVRRAGWRMPSGTGPCSSNCLLNELGRMAMRHHFGFDLYEVTEALERRLSRVGTGGAGCPRLPAPDERAARRGARMLGLSEGEAARLGVGAEIGAPARRRSVQRGEASEESRSQ